MKNYIPYIFALSIITAVHAADTDVVIETQCLAAPGLIQKIVLYGLPIITAVVVGIFMSKSWGTSAVRRSVEAGPQQTAGLCFGAWIGSIVFASLLYVTSGKVEVNDASNIIEQGTCFPAGWDMIAGVFLVITTILFGYTKMTAK